MEKTNSKAFKTGGIILAVLFILCGILMASIPGRMSAFNAWFILGALIVNGIYKLVFYFCADKEKRNGWILADGIISVLLGAMVLVDLFSAPIRTTVGIVAGMGFLIGFYEVFIGVNQLCSISVAKAAGKSSGWLIFLGILNLICGFVVMYHPIISAVLAQWIFAIYLIVFGVSKLFEAICE